MSLNWFIPALVNSSVGSFVGTSDELRTTRWPRSAKNFRNVLRISLPLSKMPSVIREDERTPENHYGRRLGGSQRAARSKAFTTEGTKGTEFGMREK